MTARAVCVKMTVLSDANDCNPQHQCNTVLELLSFVLDLRRPSSNVQGHPSDISPSLTDERYEGGRTKSGGLLGEQIKIEHFC